MSIPDTNVYARELVWRMFRDAADEDYFVARWAARAELYFQFHWSAQQSLEKYFKGILLMNDRSVKEFGHDLLSLYKEAKPIIDELVPSILCPPNYFPRKASFASADFEPTEEFLARFNDSGDSGHRYRHYSLSSNGFDLHRFDELCFRLRRLVFPLEMSYLGGTSTYRMALIEDQNLQPHDDYAFLRRKKGILLEDSLGIFKWRNFSFFESDAVAVGKINSGFFSTNSQIFMNAQRGDVGKGAIDWLLLNAKFSKSDQAQLRSLLEDL